MSFSPPLFSLEFRGGADCYLRSAIPTAGPHDHNHSSMSWTPVDFSYVRYSPVEGTHYFYDPTYPSSIQFLLSGRWEAWDVSYVKHKAQDADIRRVAEEAETRLLRDPYRGYAPWPSPPHPSTGPPHAPDDIHATPQSAVGHHPAADLVPPSPFSDAQHLDPPSPQDDSSTLSATIPNSYSSPYGDQPSVQNSATQTPVGPTAPVQLAPRNGVDESLSNGYELPPQYKHTHSGPSLQPALQTSTILSRTRETKILLSIDGDGIRGLSALLVIESLVNAICVKVGQRLDSHQIFDLTGGCSLGGVIAIMLCRLRMQAHRAREAYKQIAKQVYLNKKGYFTSLNPHVQNSNIDGMTLENDIRTIVKQELGNEAELLLDGRPDSGDVFAITTEVKFGSNKPALVRSYQTRRITGPDLEAERGPMPIWQAIKATCVAPRYTQVEGVTQRLVHAEGLVDHGTSKNNPVRDILYECRKLFRYANDMMIIVSVGTGVGHDQKNELSEMVSSVEDRNTEAKFWGDKFEADHMALMERGWMKFFRFNVTGLEDVPLEEWRHEDLIKEKTSSYLAQPEVGERFYACVDAITALLLSPQGR